jgi:nucleotide-binding universal stress UspA family protein
MSETRRFLVALAGTEDPALPQAVASVVGAGGAGASPGGPALELTLLHVEESGPRELAAYQPSVRRGPWPLPKRAELEHRLTDADTEGSAAILAIWHERFAAALPTAQIEHQVAGGLPEREIVAAAGRLNPDALILCPRPRTGPLEPGPRSVGHVARFVLDHSPVPVLLVRPRLLGPDKR